MVKARVTMMFDCISTGKRREIGEVVYYTKERAKEILSKGAYIEILETAPEPKQEPNEPKTTAVKRTRRRKNEN
jgi:hypothetical protein